MYTTHFSNIVINPNLLAAATFEGLSPISLMRIIQSCIMRSISFIFPRNLLKKVKTQVGFFVLVLTSLFCYYSSSSKQNNTGEKGYRSTLRLIHFEAFTLMSLTLSTQSKPEFNLHIPNFLLQCIVLAIIKINFMVGLVLLVLCNMTMTYSSYGSKPNDIVVDDTPEILSLLSPTINSSSSSSSSSSSPSSSSSSSSLSILRCRHVSLESSSLGRESQELMVTCHEHCTYLELLVFFNTPSPMMFRDVSFKTLSYVSLSATEYLSLLRLEWDFKEELPHLRLRSFWFHESRDLLPANVLRLPQFMGPDDRDL